MYRNNKNEPFGQTRNNSYDQHQQSSHGHYQRSPYEQQQSAYGQMMPQQPYGYQQQVYGQPQYQQSAYGQMMPQQGYQIPNPYAQQQQQQQSPYGQPQTPYGQPQPQQQQNNVSGMFGAMSEVKKTGSSFRKKSIYDRKVRSNQRYTESTLDTVKHFDNRYSEFTVNSLKEVSEDELITSSIESLINMAVFKASEGIYTLSAYEKKYLTADANIDLKDILLTNILSDILSAQETVYKIDSYKEDLAELKEIVGVGKLTPVFTYMKNLEKKVLEKIETKENKTLYKALLPFRITIVKDKGIETALSEILNNPDVTFTYDYQYDGLINKLADNGNRTIICTEKGMLLVKAGKIRVIENFNNI